MSSQVETSPDSSAVVLLSAGLDSTFNLIKALETLTVRLVLTFAYGQKAAANEVKGAARLAKHFGLRHEVVELPWFSQFTHTALLSQGSVPSEADVEIDNLKRKFDLGATRAITQMFFENDDYFRLVDRAQKAGITNPMVPGIQPIHSFKQISGFASRCGSSIPT